MNYFEDDIAEYNLSDIKQVLKTEKGKRGAR